MPYCLPYPIDTIHASNMHQVPEPTHIGLASMTMVLVVWDPVPLMFHYIMQPVLHPIHQLVD